MLDFSASTLKKEHCVSSLTDQCPHIEQGGAPEKCVTLVRGSPREEWVPPSAARAPLPLPRNHPTKNNGEAGRGLCRLSHSCSYTDYLHRFQELLLEKRLLFKDPLNLVSPGASGLIH